VNWSFANIGHGLPFGYGMLLWGPPKGGKSIITNSLIGGLHAQDPEAVAITFNTELRGALQTNVEQLKKWGVDPDRFISYDVNQPEHIFDRIEKNIAAACQEGEKVRMVVIDSLTGIIGRRTLNADSIGTQQIGDQALTIKDGLMRILPVIRKYNIALVCTAHVRAEMDPKEIARGKTVKMAAAWAAKHTFEYFCYVEPNRSKEGKTTLTGETFTNESVKDFMDHDQKTGHKIRFTVTESSVGVAGRTAEFTLDYDKGIINQHEEIFTLATNYGIIERPNNVMYTYKDRTWRGLPATLAGLQSDENLQRELLKAVYDKDLASGLVAR
jgi:RecA/RadA recombinase